VQDKFIYRALYNIQIVSKQLHINNQENNTVNVAKYISYIS